MRHSDKWRVWRGCGGALVMRILHPEQPREVKGCGWSTPTQQQQQQEQSNTPPFLRFIRSPTQTTPTKTGLKCQTRLSPWSRMEAGRVFAVCCWWLFVRWRICWRSFSTWAPLFSKRHEKTHTHPACPQVAAHADAPVAEAERGALICQGFFFF